MKKNPSKRIPLKVCQQNINLPQQINILEVTVQEKLKSQPKSSHKLSSSKGYKRMSLYSKQKSQIPTLKQAKHRQKQIISFHNRNFQQRQRRLEEIFKQNCRIFTQLNKQKSHYYLNFNNDDKMSKKSHSVSCSEYNTTKIFQHDKSSRHDSNDFLGTRLQRRFSFSFGRTHKEKQLQEKKANLGNVEGDVGIELRRYEKNKTEMIPRRNCRISFDNNNELLSFIESKTNNNEQSSTVIKNPAYIRFKRRPSSGFRC